MKKTVFLLITIAYSFGALGQQQIMLNRGVSIEMPAGAKRVTKDDALVHVKTLYKDTMAQRESVRDITTYGSLKSKHFYIIDNILIQLTSIDTVYTFEKNRLLNLKETMDEMARGATSYTSRILKGNKNTVVVMKSHLGNVFYNRFFCINDANNKELNGLVKCNKEDEEKAIIILNNLLASIKFKE